MQAKREGKIDTTLIDQELSRLQMQRKVAEEKKQSLLRPLMRKQAAVSER